MKKLKEFDYFKAWLILTIVTLVGGGLVGIMVSTNAVVLGVADKVGSFTTGLQIITFAVNLILSYLVFRFVVAKLLLPRLFKNGDIQANPSDAAKAK